MLSINYYVIYYYHYITIITIIIMTLQLSPEDENFGSLVVDFIYIVTF